MTPPMSLGSGLLGEGKANKDVLDKLLRVGVPPHVQFRLSSLWVLQWQGGGSNQKGVEVADGKRA